MNIKRIIFVSFLVLLLTQLSACSYISGGKYYRAKKIGSAVQGLNIGRGNTQCAASNQYRRQIVSSGALLKYGSKNSHQSGHDFLTGRDSILSSFVDKGSYAGCFKRESPFHGRFFGLYSRGCY